MTSTISKKGDILANLAPTTTKEQNEILTRVDPGTPMGELLRRYWWPVGFSADLKEKPTFIRLLCEDLVLFRNGKGRVGVLGALCAHRRANLCLGNVEESGLRCRYHGWLYDANGSVLEIPGEPAGSGLKESIHQLSYPVEELGGMIFAYLGPQPAPLLPRFDFIAGEGERYVKMTRFMPSNWLQCVENGIDPFHVSFTHQSGLADLHMEPEFEFEDSEWGFVHKTIRPGSKEGTFNYREHHMLMPGISVGGSPGRMLEGGGGTPVTSARWSVALDNTETSLLRVTYKPADNPGKFKSDPFLGVGRPLQIEPYREYKESDSPVLGYSIGRSVPEEDAAIVGSLSPIVDRENEHLSPVVDAGVITLRDMYLKAIETVRAGGDPQGVIRDKAKNGLIVIPAYERWISADERKKMQA